VKPVFDVVTVEPTGEAVVAGRAASNVKVELRDAGKTIAEATADASGQFVMIPPALPPGGHSLSLATGAGKSADETSNAIAIAIPAPEAKAAAVAPARLSAPEPAPPGSTPLAKPAPAADSRVAVQSVEANAAGGLAVHGAADPSSLVRLYLNGAFIADARTQPDGRWSLTIESGMTGGAYSVRADEINPADAKVVARAEAPFNYPAAPATAAAAAPSVTNLPTTAPSPALANAAPAAPALERSPADVVVASVQTHAVLPGNTLWGISQRFYGDGMRFRVIFAANANQIRDPHWIYPGQTFVVPKAEAKP
jgi:nucleoid-associated protein YgaU